MAANMMAVERPAIVVTTRPFVKTEVSGKLVSHGNCEEYGDHTSVGPEVKVFCGDMITTLTTPGLGDTTPGLGDTAIMLLENETEWPSLPLACKIAGKMPMETEISVQWVSELR